LLSAFLERMGLQVTVAHTQAEAEQRLGAGDWTLVVTDLQLGDGRGSEGLELLGETRRQCPGARSILISGSAGPELAVQARHHGADLFLTKPISFADFSSSVRSLLALV